MEVMTFLLADHAEAVKGKLYLTGGGWDQLTLSELPARHPHLSLAIGLRVPWQSTNEEHGLTIRLQDEDGEEILPSFETRFEVGRPPGKRRGSETTVLLALSMNNIEFKEEGAYVFVLEINGSEEARALLNVIKAPTAPSQTGD